jgi:ribosome-associated heat shock protein Hsp15
MAEKERLRVDKYLWCIRIFKTRSLAADACNSGKVRCSGVNIKPSKTVHVGEQYEIKTDVKKWVIEATGLLHHRVQYIEAIKYYVDLTPEEEKQRVQMSAFVFNTGKRQSKQGRPTKKNRRDLDEFFE